MKLIYTIQILALSFSSFGQNPTIDTEKDSITTVIERLFKGMKESDSSLVHTCFAEDVQMKTSYVSSRTNEPAIHTGNLQEFLDAVGTPKEQIWNECISKLSINLDDNLANAWMNYSFFIDEEFSHCGVNSIQLIKSSDGWKITDIADTRRKENCN